jgi:hypothetical protein
MLSLRVSNSGKGCGCVTILDIVENRSQMQSMQIIVMPRLRF